MFLLKKDNFSQNFQKQKTQISFQNPRKKLIVSSSPYPTLLKLGRKEKAGLTTGANMTKQGKHEQGSGEGFCSSTYISLFIDLFFLDGVPTLFSIDHSKWSGPLLVEVSEG